MNLLVRTPEAGALLDLAGTGGETNNVGQHVGVDDDCNHFVEDGGCEESSSSSA